MARLTKASGLEALGVQTTVRLSADLLARAELLVPSFQTRSGVQYPRVTRSDVVRQALLRGLTLLEADLEAGGR